MAINGFLTQTREDYAELLLAHGKTKEAQAVMELSIYEPLFTVREVHPDTDPFIKDYNQMMLECYRDMYALCNTVREASINYEHLMNSIALRLNAIKKELLIQKEMQEDINMICGNFSEFNTVMTLTAEDLSGTFSIDEDSVISAKVSGSTEVKYSIESIAGNGYEGNAHVYKDKAFVNDKLDTSARKFISDKSLLTTYEYSRITAASSETDIFELVNIDEIEAKCVIILKGDVDFNKIKISSSSKDTRLVGLEVSDDGINFQQMLTAPMALNDQEAVYKNQNGVPNSGMRCFTSTKYIRITLQSDATTDEQIAYYKTEITEKTPTAKAAFSANKEVLDQYTYNYTTHTMNEIFWS